MRRGGATLLLAGVLLAGCLAAGLAVAAPAQAPVSFEDLEDSLTCQCGCGLTVHACNHLQCESALPLREEIRAQMQLGKSEKEILAHFSKKYGEKILSAPTTRGFDLVAWVTPFVLVALGGVLVGITVARWARRPRRPPPAEPPASPASPYEKILEKELKHFDG